MADARLTRGLAIAVVILLAIVFYQISRARNRQEIARVQSAMATLKRERDSILSFVAEARHQPTGGAQCEHHHARPA